MRTMSTSGLPLVVTHQVDPPSDWDDFVMECEPSHFEQTSWWANVESGDGWSARYVVGREGSRIAAGALVLVRRQNRLGRVGYVFRGPLIQSDLADPGRVRLSLSKTLKELAHDERLALLVVVPPYDGDDLARTFLDRGFLKHPPSLSPRGLPPGTITVDLEQGIGAVEQGYRRSLGQEIKRARKRGLLVEFGSAEDLEIFWSRHQDLCRRRGVKSNVPGFDYARRVWDEFHHRGRAWMFKAVLDGEVLCSLICLGVGKWFYAWRIGWLPGSEKAYPTQSAFARAIEVATDAGYRFFDFMEIHPDDVARIERKENANSPTAGITFFKLGFGGTIRKLPSTLDWFPNPILRLVMRGVGLRFFSSGWFKKHAGSPRYSGLR
jgi:lipid II:glycine glycyltransferase (peptidoglycan interpeptide bridge formation enzyme)